MRPWLLMPRKECGREAERIAFTATPMSPLVPFLKPTGVDRPEDISRCVCDSVVRAPIALQAIRSPRYCGEIGSSASVPAGRPFVHVYQEAAGQFHAFIDAEGVVHMGIVDVTLPAGGGARLLEIDAHHDQQGVGNLVG